MTFNKKEFRSQESELSMNWSPSADFGVSAQSNAEYVDLSLLLIYSEFRILHSSLTLP
jgi:hypothetical protein